MSDNLHNKLLGKISMETELGTFLGATRIKLLESIDQHGSISQAAKAVPLSYKAAWDAVDAMNNLADEPLVVRATGGKHGGGTTLTDYGRRMVAMYRAVESEYQKAIERLAAGMDDTGVASMQDFQKLMRRMAVKTSARNQFVGPISALREGAVNFEVCLRLDDQNEIVAMVTRESAENLELTIGKEVHALVKAQSVILSSDIDIRTSARNQLWGTVEAIHPGAVNSEIAIMLPGGKRVIAIITKESVEELELAFGTGVCALFEASQVTLLVYQ